LGPSRCDEAVGRKVTATAPLVSGGFVAGHLVVADAKLMEIVSKLCALQILFLVSRVDGGAIVQLGPAANKSINNSQMSVQLRVREGRKWTFNGGSLTLLSSFNWS
jgi:hypothetical protein